MLNTNMVPTGAFPQSNSEIRLGSRRSRYRSETPLMDSAKFRRSTEPNFRTVPKYPMSCSRCASQARKELVNSSGQWGKGAGMHLKGTSDSHAVLSNANMKHLSEKAEKLQAS